MLEPIDGFECRRAMNFVLWPNDERMHHYQRGRTSITVLGLQLREIIGNRAAGRGCHDAACSASCLARISLGRNIAGLPTSRK